MPNPSPQFWAGPLRYWRWAAREKPAFFWSVIIGGTGPLMLATVPPSLKALGYERASPIPMTYPIPSGPRKTITGYDD
ncbi:NADH-ubiquinone oxidoreductase 9.5 kDa subunit [Hypoxylon rubiginosum]|uniref:NADH-ubiquinone oxidoreductase 9.5 kDa subunit n=1 Tax=Hypoxylon rubiginosum TaxID=110542 RepID=A0ACC0CXE9_9PEZI|nr:NADH-ubiquinone oxidoreductase 9.5 kDa subunit [Hypoxylon rubiginosum]